jgi:hypothetical protein
MADQKPLRLTGRTAGETVCARGRTFDLLETFPNPIAGHRHKVLARWRTTCTETQEPFTFVAITDGSFQAPLTKPGIGDGKPNRRAAGRAGYAREKRREAA